MPNSTYLEKLQIQNYVDANDFAIDTSASTLISTMFKAAILELAARGADGISVSPSGNLTSTDIQAALEELQLDIDGIGTAIAGGLDYKGGYDAATNTPDLDTAPVGVVIGDVYTVTATGLFFTQEVSNGDVIIANIDDPASLADFTIVNRNIDETAAQIAYDSSGNALTAGEVQSAIDQVVVLVQALMALTPTTPQPATVNEAALGANLILNASDPVYQHLNCSTLGLAVTFNAPVNGTHFVVRSDEASTESFTVNGITLAPGEIWDGTYGDTKWMNV